MLKSGDTFYSQKKDSGDDVPHLWVVLTDQDPASQKSVCVNITTQRDGSETTVTLLAGEHAFIKHPSNAFYTDANEKDMAALDKLLRLRSTRVVCTTHQPCSENLLKKLRDGLLQSPNVSDELKTLCARQWGIHWPLKSLG